MTETKCYRHQWADVHFVEGDDRNLYHIEQDHDQAAVGCHPGRICTRCWKRLDQGVKRRNKNNRQRGANFERTVAKQLGGRRTGPLGGRDDVVGEMFAAQTKKTINFSVRQARVYLDDLNRLYPTRIPLVVHAEPGRDRDAVVIVRMSDWLALHGPDATLPVTRIYLERRQLVHKMARLTEPRREHDETA